MSDNPVDEEDNDLDEFLEVVGQDIDPVKYFFNALRECGCDVTEREDGGFDIRNACPNLVTHTTNGFCEILCTKCYIALDIHPIDIPPANVITEAEDDIDVFLNSVGTDVYSDEYANAKYSSDEDEDEADDYEA